MKRKVGVGGEMEIVGKKERRKEGRKEGRCK